MNYWKKMTFVLALVAGLCGGAWAKDGNHRDGDHDRAGQHWGDRDRDRDADRRYRNDPDYQYRNKHADDDYDRYYGNKGAHKEAYRDGYLSGYRSGFGRW